MEARSLKEPPATPKIMPIDDDAALVKALSWRCKAPDIKRIQA